VKNRILPAQTQSDINLRVDKILRDLGNPSPPLNLETVRYLLKLDKSFYSSSDTGLLASAVHKIKIAGIQVYQRPALLKDVITKFDLRALYIPDQKRILLDSTVPVLKHRWLEAHEVVHDIIPWHETVMFGDNKQTIMPACHEQVECEANYGAGQLLFLRELFINEARDLTKGIAAVQQLKGRYNNTLTTTLWRYVEMVFPDVPMLGVVSGHPHPSKAKSDFNPNLPCSHFIQSPTFATNFSKIQITDVFGAIRSYCGSQRGGPLGASELVLSDDSGIQHVFHFETFFNNYDALTLGCYLRPVATVG